MTWPPPVPVLAAVGAVLLAVFAVADQQAPAPHVPRPPPWPDPTPPPPTSSSGFGKRTHPVTGEIGKMHGGLDLRVMQGTPLRPVTAGRVIKVSTNRPIGGNSVTIDHGNGWRSSYSHLSAVFVQTGQRVTPADLIGLSGGSPGTPGAGRSTGPHLHLQIWQRTQAGWQLVDPAPLLRWS